ncbi:hypothetical protein J2T12_001033 [Paenibacillus anaericanus]|uniref:hypothetical protein n=1 Tax=Paenibacillus anaericanus TaxID=170367 RepID=UPI00277E5878|nr:hypothetical protein [Paenibacillus anaericanus]MDQ0087627.1 hypothetical protein [Paenibacillus anaericanus]
MGTEESISEMLNELIRKVELILPDKTKQSFGSLEHFLPQMIKARDEKLYLKDSWFINSPRWLGEYGNTKDEDEIYDDIVKIELFMRAKRQQTNK